MDNIFATGRAHYTSATLCPECLRLQQQIRHYKRLSDWYNHSRLLDILAAHVRKAHAGGV